MKIFHYITIFFFLAWSDKFLLAENVDQKRSDFENRLNQAQALLDAIKSKSAKPPSGFSSDRDRHQTEFLSPPKSQSLPSSRALKIKNLRERVNRAESLLQSVTSQELPGIPDAPPINPQDPQPRPPALVSEQDQTFQSLAEFRDTKIGNPEERAEGEQSALTSTGEVDDFLGFQPGANRNAQAVSISEPDFLPELEGVEPDFDDPNTAELFQELDRNTSFEEMYLPKSLKEFKLHEVRFLYSYVYPFSSTYISTGGEGVPLGYNSGFQGEIQYLYRFSFLSLGCSVLWSEQSHKALGPLSFVGYLDASGETRSFGGSLLARISTDLGDHFSVESVLSLGLVRRLDKFQMAGVYMSEAGNSLLSSLSVALHYHFSTDYRLGLFAKYQDLAGLTRNSDSQTIQVGATVGLEF